MHQVFISYSSKNKAIADAICLHLETNGIRCWYAPRNILPGKDWVEAIMEAIESAKVFLLIYSSDSNQSRQVQNEVAAAFNSGCAIVPFRIDDTKMVSKMAYFLNSVHWLDAAHSPQANTFQELSSYIPQLLGIDISQSISPAITPEKYSEAKTTPKSDLFFEDLLRQCANAHAKVWVELTLSADHTKADQQIRGTVQLPHGNGYIPRILVLTRLPAKVQEARLAGADYVGGEELAERISRENWFEYDVVIASPEMMGIVGRMSPLLSPRGLMPSPKAGTLTSAVADAVKKIKSGQISYRMDNHNRIRCGIGKVSFGAKKLGENLDALVRAVSADKPASVPGELILMCTVTVDEGTTKQYI